MVSLGRLSNPEGAAPTGHLHQEAHTEGVWTASGQRVPWSPERPPGGLGVAELWGSWDSISLGDPPPLMSFISQTSPKGLVTGALLISKRKVWNTIQSSLFTGDTALRQEGGGGGVGWGGVGSV